MGKNREPAGAAAQARSVKLRIRVPVRTRCLVALDALQVKLGAARLTRQNGRDPGTYEMYLEGRYHCNRRTGAGFFRAVECFEQVLAKDGRIAQAWAGLADCHAFLGPLAGIPFEETMPKARAAALKALAIDDFLPDAHCSLGFVLAVFGYDWNYSEHHFRRALQLQPDHANSHVWYGGHVLAPLGRLEEAAIHARRACELDPLSPPAMSGLAGSWLMSRRPDEAVSAGKAAVDLDPGYPIALRFLGEAYLLKNMVSKAAGAFSKIMAPVIAAQRAFWVTATRAIGARKRRGRSCGTWSERPAHRQPFKSLPFISGWAIRIPRSIGCGGRARSGAWACTGSRSSRSGIRCGPIRVSPPCCTRWASAMTSA